MNQPTDFDFLSGTASEVAPLLLGATLYRRIGTQLLAARIVETEAYDQTDRASHSYRGSTARTSVMFGPAGHLYVYFTYGMHYCCNIVVGQPGEGAAVLIRAVEPLQGSDIMSQLRHGRTGVELTNGPAKTCQALAINLALNGHSLQQEPLRLVLTALLSDEQIIQTSRIGITLAKDVPWRFYIQNNSYVSRH